MNPYSYPVISGTEHVIEFWSMAQYAESILMEVYYEEEKRTEV